MKILNRKDKIDVPGLIDWLKSKLKINDFRVELFNCKINTYLNTHSHPSWTL